MQLEVDVTAIAQRLSFLLEYDNAFPDFYGVSKTIIGSYSQISSPTQQDQYRFRQDQVQNRSTIVRTKLKIIEYKKYTEAL